MPSIKIAAAVDRAQIFLTARTLIHENFPTAAFAQATIGVDGTAYFMGIGLRAGDALTGVAVNINTAGASLTLSKVGLYNKTGTRLAISADQGAAWQTAGAKLAPFTAPYTVAADDGYYLAVITKGTTQPTWYRGNNSVGGAAFGSGMVAFGNQTGQTDLPATATIANAAASINLWAGVY